jgi:hypothetical protein
MKAEVKLKNQYRNKQQVDEKPGFNEFKDVNKVQQMNVGGDNPYGKQRIDESVELSSHRTSAREREEVIPD